MKSVGILGMPLSGKTTLFEILLQGAGHPGRGEQVGVVRVPDPRVDRLSAMYRPKKTTYAQLQFVDPGASLGEASRPGDRKADRLGVVRNCEALLVVVDAFSGPPGGAARQWSDVESELILNDLAIVENRRERLAKELRVGRKEGEREHALLVQCHERLEAGHALRRETFAAEDARMLKGFQLLSMKPCLVVWNRGDADPGPLPDPGTGALGVELKVLTEREVVALPPEERQAFRAELGVAEDGLALIIRKCYELLGLISFFTVGPDEVRAWTLRRGSSAVDAAGEIHTDLARGFIRAEVVSYDHLMAAGSHAKAREQAQVRLEGKEYRVQDGDVIEIRFNR
jgi:ribosome-binding ATPase YchF (GTP1/OBG family)